MSKWRPSNLNCLYVIPDIHGAYSLLEKILKRILPLRKSDGGQDKIIFLGDYIDRHVDSHKVLDRIIELKEKYGDSVICLCGNHELMFLEGLGYIRHPALPNEGRTARVVVSDGGRTRLYVRRGPVSFGANPEAAVSAYERAQGYDTPDSVK